MFNLFVYKSIYPLYICNDVYKVPGNKLRMILIYFCFISIV